MCTSAAPAVTQVRMQHNCIIALLGTSYWHSIQMCTNHKVWIKRETTKCNRDNTTKELTRDITCKYGSRPIVHGLLSVVSTPFCSSVYLFHVSLQNKFTFSDDGESRSCMQSWWYIYNCVVTEKEYRNREWHCVTRSRHFDIGDSWKLLMVNELTRRHCHVKFLLCYVL